jgi:FkbM family methyltransferase
MRKIIKHLLRIPIIVFDCYIKLIGLIDVRMKNKSIEWIGHLVGNKSKTFTHKSMSGRSIEMSLYTPNFVCSFRADTFSTKEPETLEWIEQFGGEGKILFDIGANIGIYSIFHSLLNEGKSVSFEPSFFNLKQLTKNINLNRCEKLISVVSNPLSDSSRFSEFINGSEDEGGALSAFGVDYGFNGKRIPSNFKTNVLGFSLDNLFELGFLKDKPNLIKIDVDGIEDLILKGSINTLSSSECMSVLVEVNDDFNPDNNVSNILMKCGFHLKEKRQSEMFNESELYGRSFNQIWVK